MGNSDNIDLFFLLKAPNPSQLGIPITCISYFGLQVAKYLMKDAKFNEITSNILEEYNNTNIKSSKYNKDFYLLECELCKITSNLECHHIVFQKDFNENLINKDKIHYQKDAKYNLVTLCKECHDNIDRNIYIINGWIETTDGRRLDYLINETILKKWGMDIIYIAHMPEK